MPAPRSASDAQILNPQPLNSYDEGREQIIHEAMFQYQGPVPPPEMLAGYSHVIKNGGERLFSMVESESAHVRAQEKKILDAQISLLKRGQIFAVSVALTAIGGAIYVVQFSATVAGLMVTAGVGTLAVAFINAAKGRPPEPPPPGKDGKPPAEAKPGG